jgi:hypothetical protein
MKNLFLIFISFFSFFGISQITTKDPIEYYGYKGVPMYSDVWRIEYTIKGKNDVVGKIYPKYDSTFSAKFDVVKSKIDPKKVRELALPAFNEFRKDYNLPGAIENKGLTKIATEYAKTIPNIYVAKHSDLSANPYSPENDTSTYRISEGIGFIYYNELTRVPDSMDLNKVLADCIYDGLVQCPAHAAGLIKNCPDYEIGIGLDFRNSGMIIVLQYREKKRDL